ncbi:MAG TPA: hypothetical protein VGY77_11135 [Gemmataceae bacterium]|nr:hypothetical protein [Gemmataceae bacterium]
MPDYARIYCPRCGEKVLFSGSSQLEPAANTILPDSFQAIPGSVLSGIPKIDSSKRSRRLVAIAVLSIMAVMAAISLFLGLQTRQQRRARDQKPLGYLPDTCNVIGGLHVGKILQEEIGREFLGQVRFGPTNFGVGNLEQWTGLEREKLADVVFGLRVDDRLMPRLTLVIQTLQPYDEAKILAGLKNIQSVERNQKKLYRFQLEKTPLNAVLWFAGENTVILGLNPEDLEDVPAVPRSGIDHFPLPLQRFLTDDMTQRAHLWIGGHSDHWDKTVLAPFLAQVAGTDLNLLRDVQTFGAWAQLDNRIVASAAFRCLNEEKAQALENFLLHQGGEDKGRLRVDKDWVKFDAQPGLQTFSQWLRGKW